MKICSKCKKEYPATREYFYAEKDRPGGLEYRCKKCSCLKTTLWNKSNREKVRKNNRKSYSRHRQENNLKSKQWRENNPERHKQNTKDWINKNRERYLASCATYNLIRDKEKRKEAERKIAKRRGKNPTWRMSNNISRGINRSLKDGKERHHWEGLVGYKVAELKRHIEKQFEPGMTWENYGPEWHIDHIIPISVFNFNSPNHIDFKRCWALKNLRPLWKHENIVKRAKLDRPFQPSLAISI